MKLEDILNEINESQKDKYCMILLICGILNSQTQTEIRVVVTSSWGIGEKEVHCLLGIKFQIFRKKILVITQV